MSIESMLAADIKVRVDLHDVVNTLATDKERCDLLEAVLALSLIHI